MHVLLTGSSGWLGRFLLRRNIYGVTKLAAEGLCRVFSSEHGMACVVLRTSRFFPEEDDTHREPAGENLKANKLLHRTARQTRVAVRARSGLCVTEGEKLTAFLGG